MVRARAKNWSWSERVVRSSWWSISVYGEVIKWPGPLTLGMECGRSDRGESGASSSRICPFVVGDVQSPAFFIDGDRGRITDMMLK